MKKIILCLCLVAFSYVGAALPPVSAVSVPSEFNQDKMHVQNEKIYIISSFEDRDFVTCYDFYGRRIWYVHFHESVVSWRVLDNMILVFGKDRRGEETTLVCLDAMTGATIWQRP